MRVPRARGPRPCENADDSVCPSRTEVTVEPAGLLARVTPDENLLNDTCYAVVVAPGIEASDKHVAPLPQERRAGFVTEP